MGIFAGIVIFGASLLLVSVILMWWDDRKAGR
jgi:hypothetical protein